MQQPFGAAVVARTNRRDGLFLDRCNLRIIVGRRFGLLERLLGELNSQLESHAVVVKQGTLIDASIVSSAARRPRVEEGNVSPVDPAARFGTTNERGRYAFGYKLHVAVDAGSGLVRGAKVTPANEQEISIAPQLLESAAGTVYADRGYDSDGLRRELARHGLGDGVMRRRRGSDRGLGPMRRLCSPLAERGASSP